MAVFHAAIGAFYHRLITERALHLTFLRLFLYDFFADNKIIGIINRQIKGRNKINSNFKDINRREDQLTLDELKDAIAYHKKELKLLKSMTEAQYAIFRKNLSIGISEPSREKAIKVIESMIALNMKMQSEIVNKNLK